jgi:GT2 family glycosyltransferase
VPLAGSPAQPCADADDPMLTIEDLQRQLDNALEALRRERAMHAEWIVLITEEVTRALRRVKQVEMERDSHFKRLREVEEERDIVFNSTLWRSLLPLRRALKLVPPQARKVMRTGVSLLRRDRKEESPAPIEVEIPAGSETPFDREHYARWIERCDTLSDADRAMIRAHIETLSYRPLVSVVMPVHETPEALLKAAIASLTQQLYPHWELCAVDDASPSPHVQAVLEQAAAEDPRIRWVRRSVNGNISASSNTALELATGEFVIFLDHDDILAEKALFEIVLELNEHPSTDVVFSDEDRIEDGTGTRHSPYFKPDWDPDLILAQNFVCHLSAFRRSLLTEIGGLRVGFEGSQDHDLVLRASRATSAERIRHIPSVLYHWRLRGDASFSDTQLQRCIVTSRHAVQEHVQLIPGGAGAQVLPNPRAPNYHRVQWPMPATLPRVSVIIPTRDGVKLLRECTRGVLRETDYDNLELLIVDNSSSEPATLELLGELSVLPNVRVLRDERPFNYSALNNMAARAATGEILVFLNNDIEVIEPGWLKEMVSQALRPGIGTVGARLLYGNGTIQHAGVVLGIGEFADGPRIADHFGIKTPQEEEGYFSHSVLARTVCANTAACLAVRREVFLQAGGFDELHLPVTFNDVDFCLRLREAGLRNVWTPFAELLHLESATRGIDDTPAKRARATLENRYMRKRWDHLLDHDPYYSPHFSRQDVRYRLVLEECLPPRWRTVAITLD